MYVAHNAMRLSSVLPFSVPFSVFYYLLCIVRFYVYVHLCMLLLIIELHLIVLRSPLFI